MIKHIYLAVLFILAITRLANAQTINNFTPVKASKGVNITITGTGFTGVTAVNFGGTAAIRFTVVTTTTIVAVVNTGTSGNVSVITSSGTASLAGFTFIDAPNILYASPQVYSVGVGISPLGPSNTGSAVPATIYAQTTTIAGNGGAGSTNSTPLNSSFNHPTRLAPDLAGNLFIADRDNNLIRKISGGQVTTFASGIFNQPNGVAVDFTGNVFIADAASNSVKKITAAGVATTLAGSGSMGSSNGTGAGATFFYPYSLTLDVAGNLYVSDNNNNLIRKVDPNGVVTTFAGNGSPGYVNATGTAASFSSPDGITIDALGNLYLTDSGNNRIRKITPGGVVTTIAGNGSIGTVNGPAASASFNNPAGLAIDGIGNIYVADLSANVIRKIDQTNIVTTFAGSGAAGATNGIGTAATFNRPNDIQIDPTGSLYITDYGNNIIRKISTTGYTIDKTLPAGLVFDATTGTITGTPTSASPATTYTITAYNIGGSSTTTLVISVGNLLPQIITFPAIATVTYGAADITPLALSTNPTIPITYISSNTGVATITAGNKIHITGAGQTTITASQAGNALFNPATPVAQTLIVNPAALNVITNNLTKVYGSANPVGIYTYTGFVYNETAGVITTLPSLVTTATITSIVGNYAINGSGAVAANYTFTYNGATLTITPAPLLITANNQTRIYGAANPVLSLTYTGFITGDDASKLIPAPTVTTTATSTSPIGTYPITASGAANANYIIIYAPPGVLTVAALPRTLIFNSIADRSINDSDFGPGATVSNNDPVIYTSSDTTIAVIINGKIHIKKAGIVVITATVVARANYADIPEQKQILNIYPDDVLTIKPVVTPNGDGINDVLLIEGVKNYPDNKLTVVNLNGIKVFEATGYDNVTNTFDGHSNITGVFQPQGTYFYSFQFKMNGQMKKRVGYVVLKY